MEKINLNEYLAANEYPGRGIAVAMAPDGRQMFIGYFIMGRSINSRNRIFVERDGVLYTEPYDVSRVEDPSLIIYAAQRRYGNRLIVTNGDQTDTIYEGLRAGKTFSEALESRAFEPDFPNLTPRISGMLTFSEGDFRYEMSILKSADAAGSACNRYTFSFAALPGLGHFLHTYVCDGNPVIPTFQGEPERVAIPQDMEAFVDTLWKTLNEDNKISLFVRYTDLATGEYRQRIINRYE